MIKQEHIRLGLIAATALVLISLFSCTAMKQGNFNQRKYTHLRNSSTKIDLDQTADSGVEEPKNTIENYNQTDETIGVQNDSKAPEIVDREQIAPVSQPINTPQDELKPKPSNVKEIHQDKDKPFRRRSYYRLTEQEQNQAKIDFNWIFNTGLVLLIIGVIAALSILLFQIVGFASISYMIYWVISGFFIFMAWIFSLVGLNRVRKIRRRSYNQTNRINAFGTKLFLMRLVAAIGIGVCIVTVLGGVVLLALWIGGLL